MAKSSSRGPDNITGKTKKVWWGHLSLWRGQEMPAQQGRHGCSSPGGDTTPTHHTQEKLRNMGKVTSPWAEALWPWDHFKLSPESELSRAANFG